MINNLYEKPDKYYKKYILLLIIVWFISLTALAKISYWRVSSDIEEQLGQKAVSVALVVAELFDMKEEEYNRLLSLDFHELLEDPINTKFEKKVRSFMSYGDIKYIYLEALLPDSMVKYKVEEGEEDIYNKPVGTPLNVIYVIDAVINDETRLEDDGEGYIDKDRYTVLEESFKKFHANEKIGYYISSDRWGEFITGYAPIYDESGNYLGLIGVDIVLDAYVAALRRISYIIGAFILTNIVIGLFAIYLVHKIRMADKKISEKNILASTDSLTSILNRRRFMEILQKEWEKHLQRKEELSLFLIDVDYFKEFNDNYGHTAGDVALYKIAQLLSEKAMYYRGVVGRYGGDEFIMLLSNKDAEEANNIAEEIIQAINNLKITHQHSPIYDYQTISIGCSNLVPSEEHTIEEFIDLADQSLYKAKRYGRNRSYVSSN